jgi:hypothetical protein
LLIHCHLIVTSRSNRQPDVMLTVKLRLEQFSHLTCFENVLDHREILVNINRKPLIETAYEEMIYSRMLRNMRTRICWNFQRKFYRVFLRAFRAFLGEVDRMYAIRFVETSTAVHGSTRNKCEALSVDY